MPNLYDLIDDVIYKAFDGLSTEYMVDVEYLTNPENNFTDYIGYLRIMIWMDEDYIFAEKAEDLVKMIEERVGFTPDKWYYDGTTDIAIYWLDEKACEMAEKFETKK